MNFKEFCCIVCWRFGVVFGWYWVCDGRSLWWVFREIVRLVFIFVGWFDVICWKFFELSCWVLSIFGLKMILFGVFDSEIVLVWLLSKVNVLLVLWFMNCIRINCIFLIFLFVLMFVGMVLVDRWLVSWLESFFSKDVIRYFWKCERWILRCNFFFVIVDFVL